MKKTNFERYLAEQLKDPDFAARFKRAGEAWDVALQIAALREQAGLSQAQLAVLLKTSQQQISPWNRPATKVTRSACSAVWPRRSTPAYGW